MTWTVIYTRDMVKKMTRHCHIGDSTDSMRSGVNPEESLFFKGGRFCWLNEVGGQSWRIFIFQGWNLNFFLEGLKPKVHYITGGLKHY